ncbi:MAG: hypothetical protein AAB074_21665 [Planctomycetota bacterium]
MKRLDLVALAVSLVALTFCLALLFQNRSLRHERDEAVAAVRAEAQAALEGRHRAVEEERRVAAELKNHGSAVRALEADLLALREKTAAIPAPPKVVAEQKPKELPVEEGKHRNPLRVGQEPTKEMLESLGLDPLGEAALRKAIKDEEARVLEGLRKLYLEMVDPADHRLEDRSGQEMIMALADKLKAEIAEVEKLPQETRQKFEKHEISLEELLGEENRISRVARALHAARALTYDDLVRHLTPEQLAVIRKDYLPEGTFQWPNDVDIELGPAPKDLKR